MTLAPSYYQFNNFIIYHFMILIKLEIKNKVNRNSIIKSKIFIIEINFPKNKYFSEN